jgi:glycine/D-amino acid oxidase-like deaminating enzyme
VLIVEREPTFSRAATALSSSSIRHQFSTEINIQLSMFGTQFIKSFGDECEVHGDRPDLGFQENGYLYLVDERNRDALVENHKRQKQLGADVALLEPQQINERYPWLVTETVSVGNLGLTGEGWFDNTGLMQGMRNKARSRGVDYIVDEVVGLGRSGNRIKSATLASGRTVTCDYLVNAAGPWANDVCAMADLTIPVEPRKRCIFVFSCREEMPQGMPAVIAPNGVFCRPEGLHFLSTIEPEIDGRADREDFRVNLNEFEEHIWPTLAELVPAFESIKVVRSWAGHYEFNTLDQNGIVGTHVEVENFIMANGFSGHGLQHSPGIGRGLSELITYGQFRTLDLSPLSHQRIVDNKPLLENLVI